MHVAVLSIVDNLAICVKLMIHQLTKHKVGLGDAGCKVGSVLFFFILSDIRLRFEAIRYAD